MDEIHEVLGTESGDILKDLQRSGEDTWGWVVYRCTYKDESEWNRFMEILNAQTHHMLDEEGNSELFDNLDWSVQQDKQLLDGASKDQIRRLFRQRIDASGMAYTSPRFAQCIMIDQDALESALKGAETAEDDYNAKGYANLIDAGWHQAFEDDCDTGGEEDDDEDEDEHDHTPRDDFQDPVEGCKMRDVGWMMVGLAYLAPRTYNLLTNGGAWDDIYCRPPNVAQP